MSWDLWIVRYTLTICLHCLRFWCNPLKLLWDRDCYMEILPRGLSTSSQKVLEFVQVHKTLSVFFATYCTIPKVFSTLQRTRIRCQWDGGRLAQVLMPGLQGTWRLSESSCLNQALVPYTIMNVVSFSFLCLSCCIPTSGFYPKCYNSAISYQYVQEKAVHIHEVFSKNFSVPPVCRLWAIGAASWDFSASTRCFWGTV